MFKPQRLRSGGRGLRYTQKEFCVSKAWFKRPGSLFSGNLYNKVYVTLNYVLK